MHLIYTLWNVSVETADMLHEGFHEQPWLLVFVANLLHDKRKGELAEDDGFEDSLGVCSVT